LKKWQIRLISGFTLGPVVVLIIWHGGPLFLGFVCLCAAIALYEWIGLSLKTRHKIFYSLLGLVYISLSFMTLYFIRDHHSLKIALLFIVMIWASDISAYVFGKTFGGPKMAPKISPNKTWAGFIGATVLPGLSGAVYILIYNSIYELATFPRAVHELVAVYMAVGALIGLVGQAGDLMISLLKRLVEVKDSSFLIPGHGGLLDRVDAMMLAAPVYLYIVSKYSYVFPG
jgi:phosphatidate cytidylyltransferase